MVLTAALDELGAVGYGAFTIESVAARSGVAKSTIYRHWPGKLALISDALATLNQQPDPDPDSVPPRERVKRLVCHLAEVFTSSTLSACIPALIEAAERDPAVREFLHRYSRLRRQVLIDTIAEGVTAGDFPADLDPETAALALVGPIIYRRVMTADPLEPSEVSALLDTVLGRS